MQDFRALREILVLAARHLRQMRELIRTGFTTITRVENTAAAEEAEVRERAEAVMEKADSLVLSRKLLCSKLVFENRKQTLTFC